MAITRDYEISDATWNRCWIIDTVAEITPFLATYTAPLGPKRGDVIQCTEDGSTRIVVNAALAIFLNPIDIGNVTGIMLKANGGTSTDIDVSPLVLGSGQLNFPAVQNPSANANTLDDYEEGTWTPTITGSGGSSGQTYTLQDGIYVKVGQLVSAFFSVTLSALGTITGAVQVSGLPFLSFNDANAPNTTAVFWDALSVAKQIIQVNVLGNATDGIFIELDAPAVSIINVLTQADLSNTTNLRATLVYRAAA